MHIVKIIFRSLLPLLSMLLSPAFSAAQSGEIFTLTADKLAEGKFVELDKLPWKYRAGDDARWAAADFDDGDWKSLSNDEINSDPAAALGKWNGKAWFRLRIAVDESLVNQPLAWRMWQWGASEIYLDGKLFQSYGTIRPDGDEEYNPRGLPLPIAFQNAGTHTIAVRYSFQAASDLSRGRGAWLVRGGARPGFVIELEAGREAALKFENRVRSERLDYVFVGILWSLALVHFLLFVFYHRARGNLFYSFFVLGLGMTIWLINVANTTHFGATAYVLCDILRINFQSLAILVLLAFLYVEFNGRVLRVFWILFGVWMIVVVLQWARIPGFDYTLLMLIISLADALRIMITALVRRREGAWIIAAGIGFFVVGVGFNIAFERDFWEAPRWLHKLNLYAALLSVPMTVSLYLARNFARTNRHLEMQLAQVQELSAKQLEHERTEAELRLAHERTQAENERRAKELEEARQLQLSMLPKKLPQLPNLEIAAYMKPATEVGGDYYDFYTGADGTLTIAVGDATGHGLKAGSVVTAMKSLFNAFAEIENIPQIFQKSSAALKKMNLRGLFMAMTMLKVKGDRATIAIAGMPAVLIYRNETRRVEKIAIKAMPLGSVANFPYQETEFTLLTGDCIAVMTDGFPEMFNHENEMIGFERAAEMLPEIAVESPQEIINHFVRAAETWAGIRPADDDVTFVVLKAV